VTHICAELLANVGQMQVDLIEKIGVLLHCGGQGGVLSDRCLYVVRLVRRVGSHLRGDRIDAFRRDKESRSVVVDNLVEGGMDSSMTPQVTILI
jgi:hypothetical protein